MAPPTALCQCQWSFERVERFEYNDGLTRLCGIGEIVAGGRVDKVACFHPIFGGMLLTGGEALSVKWWGAGKLYIKQDNDVAA